MRRLRTRALAHGRTLRMRLTLWYAGAVALTGSVVVGVVAVGAASAVTEQSLDSVAIVTSSGELGVPFEAPGIEPGYLLEFRTCSESPELTPECFSPDIEVDLEADQPATIPYDELREAVIAQNERDRQEILRTILVRSITVLVVVVLLAAVLGWVLASRALRPLHQVTETARRVADDNLGERIALQGPQDEIKDLADTFDEMLTRLDESFEGQRRFVANASHELRTPLAITRTVLEVATSDPEASEDLQRVGDSLLRVNDRHERLIEGLLSLASADRALTNVTDVDVAEVVRTAVAQSAVQRSGSAGEEGDGRRLVDIDVEVADVTVQGDGLLLERLTQNLVDNAFRYNVPDGFVRVRLVEDDVGALLTVENSGPPVPPEEVDGLFEPFHRLDAKGRNRDRSAGYVKGGVGLGMSIVRSVARAHGGGATATAREGGGLVVEVRLPRVVPHASSLAPPARDDAGT